MNHKRSLILLLVSLGVVGTVVSWYWWQPFTFRSSFSIDVRALKSTDNIIPIVILGSGPAGLSAAVYGARGKMYTVVFEGKKPGGQLTGTSYVENWPGLTRELGSQIIEGLRSQAQSFGAKTINDAAVSVDFSQWPFEITTLDGVKIHALTVIIATGADPRKLGVAGEEEYWGKGVTTCAICDAPFYKDSNVVVVGGGDSAVEEALQLASYAKHITILVRGTAMRASAAMQERLKDYTNISVMFETRITTIKGNDQHVTSVDIVHKGEPKNMIVEGVFLAIGHDPNTAIFKEFVKTDANGYIVLHDRTQMTNVHGIFAAGDVADHRYRQAGVASGDGIKAALDALEFLREHDFNETMINEISSRFFDAQTKERLPLIHLATKQEFEEKVLTSKIPVVLDFYTQSCPSCLQMMPSVEQVAAQLKEKVTFYKVDAIAVKELAKELLVPTVPTLLIFKDGKLAARSQDVMTKQELLAFIERVI